MLTENQVESVFKNLKCQKTKFAQVICFTQLVFKLLSGPKFDWIYTVRLPYEKLTET